MKWLIYKHTNLVNGKIYIGQTKQTANNRWANGLGYNPYNNLQNCVFWNAIQKYGWDNFKHEIIEDNIQTKEEADKREKYWIKHFNSYIGFNNSNGYNMTLGGSSGEHLGYPLYQIDKSTHVVLKEFSSAAEASRSFGTGNNSSRIRRCCEGLLHSAKGYYWCYKKDYNEKWTPKDNQLVSPVFQINDDFEVVRRYESITECVKLTGFSGGSIVSCCKRKQRKANNYYWCYVCDYNEKWSPPQLHFNRNEKVYCFETNETYASSKVASMHTGANRGHILRCCKGKENGANGLHFCYADKIDAFEMKRAQVKGALFTKAENDIIRQNYPVLGMSKDMLKLLPNRTENSIRQQAHRLGLRMTNPIKNSYKKVVCIETNRVFNSIEEAYVFAGLKDGSSISRCCKGTRQMAGGYHWKYFDEDKI